MTQLLQFLFYPKVGLLSVLRGSNYRNFNHMRISFVTEESVAIVLSTGYVFFIFEGEAIASLFYHQEGPSFWVEGELSPVVYPQ